MGHKHQPRKRFGQHFLHDTKVLDRIISVFNPTADQRVVEVGPGRGALTERLLRRLPHLRAIEIDRDLVQLLRNQYTTSQLTLIEDDVLRVNLSELAEKPNSLYFIGNLPYNISTPLIFHLLRYIEFVADILFMMQKEVAQRMVATPGSKEYGRLSIMVGVFLKGELVFDVFPTSFKPAPKVESTVIRLKPKTHPFQVMDLKLMNSLVVRAFSQRRKMIKNALDGVVNVHELKAVGIDPKLRPESIAVKQYVDLSNKLAESVAH